MLEIIYGNIIEEETEAIVNASNNDLVQGSGVCGAIFNAAGSKELKRECIKIGHCKTGEAVITKGYNLKSKYIIHTVGPVYINGNNNEENDLRNAYRNTLKLAKKHNITSISFPLISSGVYGYPYENALYIAKDEILKFLNKNSMEIRLMLFRQS